MAHDGGEHPIPAKNEYFIRFKKRVTVRFLGNIGNSNYRFLQFWTDFWLECFRKFFSFFDEKGQFLSESLKVALKLKVS